MMDVTLWLRTADGEPCCMGTGHPATFMELLGEHGFYLDGLTKEDPHTIEGQWIASGFEAVIIPLGGDDG